MRDIDVLPAFRQVDVPQTSLHLLDTPARSTRGITLTLILVAGLLAGHAFLYWMAIDDSYISFRYARNVLDGNGLVYNPGQYVEGYTSFAWVILIAALTAI